MADIDYPNNLPGVLVNSNGYQPQSRVAENSLQSGPPIFGLQDDDGYVMFDVAWTFNALEMQVFRNFFRVIISSGSRLFNIDLMVEGDATTHECYFKGVYKSQQSGKLWHVSATLLAIEEVGILSLSAAITLVSSFSGFDYSLDQVLIDMESVVVLLENTWV